MDIVFTPHAWEDLLYWHENDKDIVKKIITLINIIKRTPFMGEGKPEALKHGLKGYWSRRITQEHRLVYKVSGRKGGDQRCTVIQCRFHYQ